MPTTKPRISITIEPEDLAVLDRYAQASGSPRASMIAQMIHAACPELERAAELIEMANAAPAKVIRDLVDDLHNATADAMGFLEPFHADYHRVLSHIESRVADEEPAALAAGDAQGGPAARGVPARRRPRRPDPHLLTGGSNS